MKRRINFQESIEPYHNQDRGIVAFVALQVIVTLLVVKCAPIRAANNLDRSDETALAATPIQSIGFSDRLNIT